MSHPQPPPAADGRSVPEDRHRLTTLSGLAALPEVQPARPWQWILHNQRGFVLDRAIQKGTDNVVICRLHFRRSIWSAQF